MEIWEKHKNKDDNYCTELVQIINADKRGSQNFSANLKNNF